MGFGSQVFQHMVHVRGITLYIAKKSFKMCDGYLVTSPQNHFTPKCDTTGSLGWSNS